jgi:WD40 repeat protein
MSMVKRIFLSYGHDEHAWFATRLRDDLQLQGYEVWFDAHRLKAGADWENYIADGLDWVSSVPGEGRLVLLMTPHSVRRPDGFCLNELARALGRRIVIIPVMLVRSEPPLPICRLQWLDMQDCIPAERATEKYSVRLSQLFDGLESGSVESEGLHARLLTYLSPLPHEADFDQHVPQFVGRAWVNKEVDKWIADKQRRILWITGEAGVGKTALSAWLATTRREIAAIHFCRAGNGDRTSLRKALFSLSYQLTTQLPDYRDRLNASDLDTIRVELNGPALFTRLFADPLARLSAPDRPVAILIDALDEATEQGVNQFASLIATEFARTPPWLRLIVTSRPHEDEIRVPLQGLDPWLLDAHAPDNMADIRAYLEHRINAPGRGGSTPRAIIDEIVRKSEGLFLYVHWICEELNAGRVSVSGLRDLPAGLGGIYTQFFNRYFQDSALFSSKYRPVLEVICAAREPLELSYLSALLGWSEYESRKVVQSLGSLFPTAEGRIRPFHQSVYTWLTSSERAGPYYVNVTEGHKLLAEFGWRKRQHDPQEVLRYSICHLLEHLVTVGRWENVQDLLMDFAWMQARLRLTDITALLGDYDYLANNPTFRLIQGALGLSAHVLASDKEQLAGQLFGRLLSEKQSEIQAILGKADKEMEASWLRPLTASLIRPGGALVRTLSGHASKVLSVAVTSDGQHVLSTSDDGVVKLWKLESGKEVFSLATSDDGVTAATATPDGKLVITATHHVSAISATPDGKLVITATHYPTLNIWNLETRQEVRRLATGLTAGVTAAALTPNGVRVISGSYDGQLKVWNLENADPPRTLLGHSKAVNCVRITSDGKFAVSASDDKTLKVWDLQSAQHVQTLEGHTDRVTALALTLDGKSAISASFDGTLKVWNLEDGRELGTLISSHRLYIRDLAVTPDSQHVISASHDDTLKVWDFATNRETTTLKGHDESVTAVAVTPDGKRIVSASADQTVKIWDFTGLREPERLTGHSGGVNALAMTLSGTRVVSASYDNTVRVWHVAQMRELRSYPGHTHLMAGLAVSPDGERMVLATWDGTLRVRDLRTGRELRSLIGHTDWVNAVAVTPDGSRAISGSRDCTVKVWDLASGRELRTLRGHKYGADAVAVTPDGNRVVSVSENCLKVWQLDSGSQIHSSEDRDHDRLLAVTTTPDGKFAVTGSHHGRVRVWELHSGREVQTFYGHTDWVYDVAVMPDSQVVISASKDRTLRAWSFSTGKMLAVFTADGGLHSCAVAPKGTIVAGDSLGMLHFLTLEIRAPIATPRTLQ